MNYKRRLERLTQELKPERPIFKIEFCTEERAAEFEAERTPTAPGEIRYIIVPPEHMPMWFGPLDET